MVPINVGDKKLPRLGPFFSITHGFWQNAEKTIKEKEINIDLNGLDKPVTVIYDERWVPHIFAESISDANYIQGYILAQNRLFQMDISTRSAGGRLTELVGERALELDKLARRRGWI